MLATRAARASQASQAAFTTSRRLGSYAWPRSLQYNRVDKVIMDYSHLIALALGLLAGAVAALKIIAPLTKTTKDDAVLEKLEKVEDVVAPLAPKQ